MMPAVPLPSHSPIRTPVDVELKPGWRFLPDRRVFRSDAGEEFAPRSNLPKYTRIVHKVPNVARSDEAELSEHERELRRYLQVILPKGHAPQDYVETIRSWPCVAEAHAAPEVSLP
jgi:hypothetical protein